MSLKTYRDLEQGSDEWRQARCGILTASVMGQMISPKTLKVADNETSRTLTRHLVAERITGHVEDTFTSDDMLRGTLDEPHARDIYAEHYAPVEEVGFMVRTSKTGCALGYSPDGLVGADGLIEIKSRRQKHQLATILADEVPQQYMAQIQTGLLVSGRQWCEFISYCGGMPLYVKRVEADPVWHEAIVSALQQFETTAGEMIHAYQQATKDAPMTERVEHFMESEITL